jgi:uncharacterized protein (TIGR02466 family)
MRILNHTLFPTLVSHIEGFLSEEQVRGIFEYIIEDSQGALPHRYLHGDTLSSYHKKDSTKTLLRDVAEYVEGCGDVVRLVEEACREYSEDSGMFFGGLANSWYNLQNKGSYLERHCHSHSALSGALFINTDQYSSPLIFDNPNPYPHLFQNPVKTPYTELRSEFRPSTGDLVIFPSWLHHHSGMHPNMTDNRVVISFNTHILK